MVLFCVNPSNLEPHCSKSECIEIAVYFQLDIRSPLHTLVHISSISVHYYLTMLPGRLYPRKPQDFSRSRVSVSPRKCLRPLGIMLLVGLRRLTPQVSA